jgi:signal transduction histidine kinase
MECEVRVERPNCAAGRDDQGDCRLRPSLQDGISEGGRARQRPVYRQSLIAAFVAFTCWEGLKHLLLMHAAMWAQHGISALVEVGLALVILVLALRLLAAQQRELAAARDTRDRLASALANDLRQPLVAAVGALSRLDASTEIPLETRRTIARATQSIRSLVGMAVELLRTTPPRAERYGRQPVRCPDLLRRALRAVEAFAASKHVEVQSEIDDSLPPIAGLPSALFGAFAILLENALAGTPSYGRLSVAAQSAGPWGIEILIRDAGIALGPAEREALEGKGFRHGPVVAADGLSIRAGLQYCAAVVNAHGGAIHIESDGQWGNAVVISLPVAISPAPATGSRVEEAELQGSDPPLSRKTRPIRKAGRWGHLRSDPLARVTAAGFLVFALWQVLNHVLLMRTWQMPMVTYHLVSAVVETTFAGVVAAFVLRALSRRTHELTDLAIRKDLLTRAAVHDLKKPLAALTSGLFTAIHQGHPTRETKDWLQTIQVTAADMNAMVNDLVDIADLEAGQKVLRTRDVALADVVSAGAGDVGLAAWEKGVDLWIDVPEDLPLVAADSARLRRVVMNLIDNAVRFTPTGGRVRVDAVGEPERRQVVVSVSDTGEGIPRAGQRRIFDESTALGDREPFGRSPGLGLAFCKLVVEAHGGRIWVQSDPGHGATFFFSVPTALAGAA